MILEKDREFKKQLNFERQKARISQCIWGQYQPNTCEGKIIKAHSIQRSKILKKISNNGLIKTLELITENGNLMTNFENVGIKKFSTFNGFCGKHDKEIFQPIENKLFNGELEQKYIYAYRAITKEYHTIKESIYITDNQLTKAINDKKNELKLKLEIKLFQSAISIIELEDIIKFFQDNIINKNFNGIKHHHIILEQEYPIACCSIFIPYYDFLGNSLFSEEEKQQMALNPTNLNDSKYLFVNIFPENGKTNILISYFKNQKKRYKFLNKLLKIDINKLKIAISDMMINYIENIAFSPKYIEDKFSEKETDLIKKNFIRSIIDSDNFNRLNLNLFRDNKNV